jgi:mono/diheme cytochrome c family protein
MVRVRYWVLVTLVALLAACSLAEDTTPPPGYVTPVPTATPVPDFPKSKPSIPRGASVYAQNCTRCHGVSGKGDGEMVSQITVPVPAFTNPELAFNTTPERWFKIITNGNIERFMPPWADTIPEGDRWHVIAYLYSLSATEQQVKQGQTVYAANCEQCHGSVGAGDGPKAQGTLPNFTDQAYMTLKANKDFYDALAQSGHDFTTQLADTDRRAVVDYVRSLSLDTQPPVVEKGTITGKLSNGTSGSTVPANQEVSLRIFDNFQEQHPLTATVKADGTFAFDDLDLPEGRAFIVTTRYADVLYASEVAEVAADTKTYDLPITIYETTTDAASLTIDRLHIVFDFQGGAVQVGELVDISNNSAKAYVGAASGGPTLQLPLPAGYSELTFQDGQIGDRYQKTADGFADTLPIVPGADSRQILLSYKLPYTDSLTLSQVLPYSVGTLNFLVPDVGVTISGDNLADSGVSDVQGGRFHTYTRAGLPANAPFAITLSGQPTAISSGSAPIATAGPNWRNILIGILSLALVASIIAYWWTGQMEKTETVKAGGNPAETLLDAIARLDDEFEAGKLDEAKYQARREKLKAELRRVMEKETSGKS